MSNRRSTNGRGDQLKQVKKMFFKGKREGKKEVEVKTSKWWVIGGMLMLAILVFGAVGWAADWYVDASVETPGDGTSWTAAFKTIQEGVTAAGATGGDIINVAAGTYDEQVVIDKSLTLQGAGDTTIIKPSQTTANGFQTFTRFGGNLTSGIVVANANGANVTVKDLKVDGELVTSTPSSTSLIGIFCRETGGTIDNVTVEDITVETGNGMYLSAETETVSVEVKNSTFTNYQKNGINANGGTLTANIHNNTVTGRGPLGDGDHCQNGIQLWDSEGTITGNTVSDHFYTPATSHATGILLYHAKSSTVSGNTLTDNQEGIALDYYTDGSGSGVTVDVDGGTITGGTYGITIGGDPTLGSDLTCNVGNTAAVTVDGASYAGIYVTRNVNLTLSNSTIKNTASGGYGGVYLYLGECPVTIDNNTIQLNGGSGIYVLYVQGLVTIDNNTIQSNGDYGIMSYGLEATPNVLAITNNTITGSPTGIGSYRSTTTAHNNDIHGNTDYGVVNWDATVLDAENNWWGSATGPYQATTNPSGLGNAVSDNVDYSPYYTDAAMTSSLPVYNTTKDLYYSTIQAAIDGADGGNTITVAAGTYNERVVINKPLTLEGEDRYTTIIDGTSMTAEGMPAYGNNGILIFLGSSYHTKDVDITIRGFTVQNFAVIGAGGGAGIATDGTYQYKNITISNVIAKDNGLTGLDLGNVVDGHFSDIVVDNNDQLGNGQGYGIWLRTSSNNNVFTNIEAKNHDYIGIEVMQANNNIFTNVNCTGNAIGIDFWKSNGNTVDSSSMSGGTYGLYFDDSDGNTVENSTISGNTKGVKCRGGTGSNQIHSSKIEGNTEYGVEALVTLNATNNYWGSASGPQHAGNTFNVGSQGDKVSDNVDYLPWYDTDKTGTSFAPVTTDETPAGEYSSIQAAIDGVTGGTTITCAAGMYTENVNVDKSLTLQGASSATVTVNAVDPAVDVFKVTANSVNISGFTVSGAATAGHGGIYLNAGVSLCNIHNNIATGNYDGIWLGAGSHNNTLSNNTLTNNYQGFEVYISDDNTFTGNVANSNAHYGFKIDSGDSNQFTDNTANSNTKYGFYVVTGDGGGCSNTTFTNNTASLNTSYGIRINGGSDTTLTGNTFDSNGVSGLRLKETMTTLTLTNNNFTNNPIGIEITDSVDDVSTWTVNHNKIAGNADYGVLNGAVAGTLDAEYNWWGACGPSGEGPGTGDAVSTNVDFDPWYTDEAITTTATMASNTYGNAGYNLVSVPLQPMCSGNGDSVFEEAGQLQFRLLRYNPSTSGYDIGGDLTVNPEYGFWLYLSAPKVIDMGGTDVTDGLTTGNYWETTVDFGPGWQQMGVPFTTNLMDTMVSNDGGSTWKTVDEAMGMSPGWLNPNIFSWNSTTQKYEYAHYEPGTGNEWKNVALQAWDGGWVKNESGGNLKFKFYYDSGVQPTSFSPKAMYPSTPWRPMSELAPGADRPPAPPVFPQGIPVPSAAAISQSVDVMVAPNPVQQGRGVEFRVVGEMAMFVSSVSVQVYTIGGQLVFDESSMGQAMTWGLTTLSGEPVANGLYLYVAQMEFIGGQTAKFNKLLILK